MEPACGLGEAAGCLAGGDLTAIDFRAKRSVDSTVAHGRRILSRRAPGHDRQDRHLATDQRSEQSVTRPERDTNPPGGLQFEHE